MMKIYLAGVLLFVTLVVEAVATIVSLELLSEIQIGGEWNQMEFANSSFTGVSPSGYASIDGRTLWIGGINDAKAFDIGKREIVQTVPYPTDPTRQIGHGLYHVFLENALFVDNGVMSLCRLSRNPLHLEPPKTFIMPRTGSRPYAIKDYVFFYTSDGFISAIDSKGTLLTNKEATEIIQGWLKVTWYASAMERDQHAKMISTGRYIIADATFYPASGRHLFEYFTAKGSVLPPELYTLLQNSGSSAPDGVSTFGDIYLPRKTGIYVVSQSGNLEAIIEDNSINPVVSDSFYSQPENRYDVGALLHAVNANGDVYTLYAIKGRVAQIHRATKAWGNDLIGMARKGVTYEGEVEMGQRIAGLSSVELRILRNTVFALHGYIFKSWDLSCFFKGYDWYMPDPEKRSDLSFLTAEQRRLFDLVVAVEKQRTVAP